MVVGDLYWAKRSLTDKLVTKALLRADNRWPESKRH